MNNLESTNCQVFVGNLPSTVTTSELFELGSRFGSVVSATVARHDGTKKSKGWGNIRFADGASAAQAAQAINGITYFDRQLNANLDRTTDSGAADKRVVYVGNLSWEITDSYLAEVFISFNPMEINVMRNMYGRSRGCALVKFKTEEEAEYFIQEMNGQDLDGRILECRHDKGPTKRENDELRNASSNPGQQAFIQKSYGDTYSSGSAFGPNTSNLLSQVVFHVGNLGPRTTDYVLYQLFSAYGKVTSVNVNSSGDPWGKKIGLVTMEGVRDYPYIISQLYGANFADTNGLHVRVESMK